MIKPFLKKIFLAILILNSFQTIAQKNFLWSNGGAGNDEALDNAVDQFGKIYTTGYFSLSSAFGDTVLSSYGSGDIFVSKQDSQGVYLWTVQAGGPASDRAYSITTDAQNNILITGFFSGTASFGSISLTSSNNSQDVFVAKLDPSGNFLWANKFGGTDIDLALAVNADANGNVMVTGQFKGTAQFGTNTFTSATDPNTNAPSYDIFILKLDGGGNFLWSKQGAAKYDDRGLGISSDLSGNIYVTGQFSDTLYFANTYLNNAYNAGFLLKLDPSGNEIWMRTLFATLVTSYSVRCYGNDIYLTGDFQGNLTITGPVLTTVNTTYPYSIFVIKFDDSGNVIWTQHSGSNSTVSSLDIALDQAGDAYITGLFTCIFSDYSALFGPGLFNSSGFRDVFVSKISASGQLLWEKQFGSSKDDFCSAISVITYDEPVIAGSFERGFNIPRGSNFLINSTNYDSSAFGPLQPSFYCNDYSYRLFTSASSAGSKDIFSAKPVDLKKQPYDFYDRASGPCVFDVPLPFIINPYDFSINPDTLFACGNILLSVFLRTGRAGVIGPEYTFLWSNGSTTSSTNVSTSGYYWVQAGFTDQCRTFTDSVYVKLEAPPALPTITSSLGTIHDARPVDSCVTKLLVFDGDTAILVGGNITPGYNFYWQTPNGIVYNDSVVAVPDGNYTFTVISPHDSCISEKCIYVYTYDTLNVIHIANPLIIVFTDSLFQATDTVRLCKNDVFTLMAVDSDLWVNNLPTHVPIFISWSINFGGINFAPPVNPLPPYTFYDHIQGFSAVSSGNCSVTITGYHPEDNSFYFSYTKTFYLEVLPLPVDTVHFNGPNFFCPGDTVMLTLSGGASYQISGPPVIYSSPGNDTLLVNKAGTYRADYTLTDSITGCSKSGTKTFLLSTNPSPLVTIIPSNGVICPGDSVQLIAQNGLSYNWVGPLGNALGTGQSIYVHSPGYYHYEFIDSSGCALISEFKEVKAYTTPYLDAIPVSVLCPGGSVTIHVYTIDTTQIQWQPPLSGTGTSQVITQPGTYLCSITVCGITTIASLTVTQSNIYAAISVNGPAAICNGEPLTLIANNGFPTYNWQPGNGDSSVFTVTQPGIYYLQVTDSAQCTANDSVSIIAHDLVPPSATGDTVCQGDSARLTAGGTGTIKWYDSFSGTVPVSTGAVFITPPLFSSIIYYVANADSVCSSTRVSVQAGVRLCIPIIPNVFTPNGDGSNDGFVITYEGAKSLELIIYNRWGQEIIVLNGTDQVTWNGRDADGDLMPVGTYYYILSAINYKNFPEKYSGFLELIR
jgi:gliding motility-associated-like protein